MESIFLQVAVSVLIFIIGASVGSFLNLVIWRLPKNEGIFRKRSYCPKCKATLAPVDLVPIFSFLFLRGRCRNCGKPISIQYPIVEAITGILFLASFLLWMGNFGLNVQNLPRLFHLFFIISVLIVVFVIDAKFGIIPDQIVKFAIIGSVFLVLVQTITQFLVPFLGLRFDPSGFGKYLLEAGFAQSTLRTLGFDLLYRILAAVGTALFFGLSILVTKGRGMGAGDAKFGFWLGFAFSLPQILQVLFLSFLTGAIAAIFLILIKKKKFGETLPLGPFLAIGALITLFFGNDLLTWYLGTLR